MTEQLKYKITCPSCGDELYLKKFERLGANRHAEWKCLGCGNVYTMKDGPTADTSIPIPKGE